MKLHPYFPSLCIFIFLIMNGLLLNSEAQKMDNTCTTSEVRTQIVINADPTTIWNILLDVKNYPSWNPYIYEITGTIKKGSFVNFRMKNGDDERKFKAQILELKTNETWAWGGSLLFFFKARHYFILQPIDATHTRLIQGEYWHGLFGKNFGKKVYRDACVNFEKMNVKLKQLAEGGRN